MSKARNLADFVSAGNPLSDGVIQITDIENVTINHSELNNLAGSTHNVQDQISELDDENLLNLGV